MSGKFRTINRDTAYLLPPSLQDWLPQKHLARFVVEMVDQLDLRVLESAYRGVGKPPYHPAVLLALLFYGYATGVFSSRKLEQATYLPAAGRRFVGVSVYHWGQPSRPRHHCHVSQTLSG